VKLRIKKKQPIELGNNEYKAMLYSATKSNRLKSTKSRPQIRHHIKAHLL